MTRVVSEPFLVTRREKLHQKRQRSLMKMDRQLLLCPSYSEIYSSSFSPLKGRFAARFLWCGQAYRNHTCFPEPRLVEEEEKRKEKQKEGRKQFDSANKSISCLDVRWLWECAVSCQLQENVSGVFRRS